MIKQEIELSRTNVTPAEFCAYVRHQLRKHEMDLFAIDIDLEYWKAGNDMNFNIYHENAAEYGGCDHEISVSKPYEMQTYVHNADGSVYNQIMEFNFWDDKKGSAYFYLLNIC